MTMTNVVRLLKIANIQYRIYEYDISDGKIDGLSVAQKIGQEPGRIYKTLVTTGKITGINVYIIPVLFELDLKKAAHASNDKHIEMIKSLDLKSITGYIHGGCSPIGMRKLFPTFIETTAKTNKTIIVSAGRIGLQIEISSNDLAQITKAIYSDLI